MMQTMTTCWACEASLDPVWKFCTQCGVPIEKDAEIPSAIRPDTQPARAPITPLAVFGWIMAGIGVALVLAAIVVFVLARR
jgi:hypothetical protein